MLTHSNIWATPVTLDVIMSVANEQAEALDSDKSRWTCQKSVFVESSNGYWYVETLVIVWSETLCEFVPLMAQTRQWMHRVLQ